jgi:hypothetical protein
MDCGDVGCGCVAGGAGRLKSTVGAVEIWRSFSTVKFAFGW